MERIEPASNEELVRFLEEKSGRRIKTREDIRAYIDELAIRNIRPNPSAQRWSKVKQATLAGLLAYAFIQYYMVDVLHEIASMPQNVYFLPAAGEGTPTKALDRT